MVAPLCMQNRGERETDEKAMHTSRTAVRCHAQEKADERCGLQFVYCLMWVLRREKRTAHQSCAASLANYFKGCMRGLTNAVWFAITLELF